MHNSENDSTTQNELTKNSELCMNESFTGGPCHVMSRENENHQIM